MTALAPSVLRALAVLAAAQWAGVVPAADAAAARAWLARPGRFPDEAAVAAYLDPSAPMPEGDALPPRLRLLGDDARLAAFVRALPGIAPGVTVRTVPQGPSRFDQPSRVVYLAESADLPALLHEAGHAAVGTDEEAVYQRTFRDFPGCARPEDAALFQCEREADAAYSADLLSAARATRSYWRGIRGSLSAPAASQQTTGNAKPDTQAQHHVPPGERALRLSVAPTPRGDTGGAAPADPSETPCEPIP